MKKRAQSLLDQWSRQINNIQSEYDREGDYDFGYRKMQNKLEKLRKQSIPEDQDNEVKGKKRLSKDPSDIGVVRNKMGVTMGEKNAFNFTERPERREINRFDQKKSNESGRGKINKTLLNIKKANTRSEGNKDMATVKRDV